MTTAGALPPIKEKVDFRAALRIRRWPAVAILLAMLVTAVAAQILMPKRQMVAPTPDLERIVPRQLEHWREVPSLYAQAALVVPNREAPSRDQPYDAVLMRNYVGSDGRPIMLALAYAAEQRQDIKIHRPEACYPAQGFELLQQRTALFPVSKTAPPIPGAQLLMRNRQRIEAVSYWIRVGDAFPRTAWSMRSQIFRDGLAGRISDGMLVRVSTLVDDAAEAPAAYAQQQRFLADLVHAVNRDAPGLLVPGQSR